METPFSAYQGDDPFIFVCYAHDDAALVYPEITRLHNTGFHVWYDEGISPGSEWSASLAEHIEKCTVFLYFITPRSVEREHCRREVNFALDQSCSILPVHLEVTEVPSALKLSVSHRQAILKYEHQETAYEEKLDQALAIASHADFGNSQIYTQSDSDSRDKAKTTRSNGYRFLALLVLAILVSVLFAWWYPKQEQTDTGVLRKTVAIAPLESVAGDRWLEGFAKTIELELIHNFSDRSPTGVRLIKDQSTANFVLQGTLQHVENGTRFTVQVIRANDGTVLWSTVLTAPYEPDKPALFTRADYLATMVKQVIWLAIDSETDFAEAQSQYISGSIEWLEIAQGYGGDLGASVAHYQRAIELDPNFVAPIRQLGILYRNRFLDRLGYQDAVDKAHEYARRVLELDPNDTFLIGIINASLDLDYPAALANIEHARRHGWSMGEIEYEIGQILLIQGKLEEALRHLETAIRVGAITNRSAAGRLVALAHLAAGRYQESKDAANEAVSLSEGSMFHLSSLALKVRACYYSGDSAGANEALDIAWSKFGTERPELFPGDLALLGRTELARRILEDSEERYQRGELPTAQESFWGNFYLGNVDEAMVWLNRAIENRESLFLPMLRRSELLDDIREDPRFQQAMNKLAVIEAEGTPTKSVAYPQQERFPLSVKRRLTQM